MLAFVIAGPPGLAGAGFLPREEEDKILGALEERGTEVRTLFVRFEQERRIPGLEEPVVSRGFMVFSRPQRLHWEWTEPLRYLVIVDGGRVGSFERIEGRARRLDTPANRVVGVIAGKIMGWIEGRYRQGEDVFEVHVRRDPDPLILLIPSDAKGRRFLRRIEVHLAPDLRVSWILFSGATGEETVLRFSGERLNQDLDENLFSVEEPAWILEDASPATDGGRAGPGSGEGR